MATYTLINPRTNKEIKVELGASGVSAAIQDFFYGIAGVPEEYRTYQSLYPDGYRYNNPGWVDTDAAIHVLAAADYFLKYGWEDTAEERDALYSYISSRSPLPVEDDHLDVFIDDAKRLLNDSGNPIDEINREVKNTYGDIGKAAVSDYQDALESGLTPDEILQQRNEQALSEYYRQSYSLDPGTVSGDIYARLVEMERNAALDNMRLADAQTQQLAMSQAATVQALADEVRADRMDRLRAGLSEAQLANEEMSQMMANMNTLNQQTANANLARLQAQQQYDNAQDAAYTAWLEQAQALGQTGSAFYASSVGDIIAQALKLYQNPQLKPGVGYLQNGGKD